IEESTIENLYSDEFNSLSDNNNEERNSSDNEELASTSTSTSKLKCDTEYLWLGSTSNLINHLRDIYHVTKKSLVNKSVKVHQQTIQQVIMKPYPVLIQKKLTNQVVQYIVLHVQLIHLVEIDDFKLLLKKFDPRFKMPCVNTIKMIIFDSYNSAVKQIINLISRTSDTISLTFDIWSSHAHDSYLGITCHWLTDSFELYEIVLEIGELDDHCADDIVESVNSVLDKFNINHKKVFSITTDNGANVKSAIQKMDVTNIKYAGHTLQLSVNLELKEIDKLISKCLKEPLDVIKDIDTKWNSTFYSIEHLIRRRAETMSSFLPSEDEFELLNKLIVILSPFNEATQFLSGSEYPTLGFMTPILEELTHQLRQFTRQSYKAILVKDTILNNLVECWGDP
ncbi:7664_t:CDS:2, partial [Cetraspora pellucida]